MQDTRTISANPNSVNLGKRKESHSVRSEKGVLPLRSREFCGGRNPRRCRRLSLCPVQKAFWTLLCFGERSAGGDCHHGSGKLVLVPIVSKGTSGLLLHVRIVVVLGSARDGVDRRRNGRLRDTHLDSP